MLFLVAEWRSQSYNYDINGLMAAKYKLAPTLFNDECVYSAFSKVQIVKENKGRFIISLRYKLVNSLISGFACIFVMSACNGREKALFWQFFLQCWNSD